MVPGRASGRHTIGARLRNGCGSVRRPHATGYLALIGAAYLTPNGEARLVDVTQMPLVAVTPGWAIRYAVDRAFRPADVDRSTTFEANDIVAAAEPARNDLGVCIMPRSIADRFPDLPRYRFDRHPPNWKNTVVRPPGEAPPAAAALLRHIT
ncbi:LysR substrate-binding domain-containing protein [Streptomyces lydicus]